MLTWTDGRKTSVRDRALVDQLIPLGGYRVKVEVNVKLGYGGERVKRFFKTSKTKLFED